MNKSIYYNGIWQTTSIKELIQVTDPSNGDVIGNIQNASDENMIQAIDSAADAFGLWSKSSAYYRCDLLEKLYDLVIDEKESLAQVMTKENGKPYSESLGEVIYGANFIKWYSEEGKRIYGEMIPSTTSDKRIMVRKEPIGLVYGITPWNFPFAMLARKIAPALAAGCSFIIKPSEETPLTAVRFFELVDKVGFPKGVLNMITGDANRLTDIVMQDSRVRKVTFTGSTLIGKQLMAKASQTVKNISLELGGHAPLIVFEDADIKKAVEGTIASKFRNCGQVCIASNRVYVHTSVKEKYLESLVKAVESLKIGNGFEEAVTIGPIINQKGFMKIQTHIQDAIQKGATLVTGGVMEDRSPYYVKPTILDGVTSEMIICSEETFGPVIPIITFTTDDEVIEQANASPYGLAAYFFTESMTKSFYVSEGLEYGIIGINTGSPSTAQAPFGGFKESGIGREGGHFGIDEYLETKYVCFGL